MPVAHQAEALRSQSDRDAAQAALMFTFADQLKAAAKTLDRINLARPAFDALMDRQVYPGELDVFAREIEVIADIWQGEIDEPAPSQATGA